MKQLRKNVDNNYICEECGRIFVRSCDLGKHINFNHMPIKIYFNKWIKEDNDGICKICGNQTKFFNLTTGYQNSCNETCRIKLIKQTKLEKYGDENYNNQIKNKQTKLIKYKNEHYNNREKNKQTRLKRYGNKNYNNCEKNKQTCLEKYGVSNVFQLETTKKKSQETSLKRYGTKCPMQSDMIKENTKQTCLKKYGVEHVLQSKEFKEISKKTCLAKYNVEYSLQNDIVRKKGKETKLKRYGNENYYNKEKVKQTNLKKYGVEYPTQNKSIFEKQQKSAFKLKQYKNTNVWYQGMLEFDFLEKYYFKYQNICRGTRISYKHKNKKHYYFPDFYIPSINLIIECKNSWLAKRDKSILIAKKKAVIINGFNYIMIIDKNYKQFDLLISSLI